MCGFIITACSSRNVNCAGLEIFVQLAITRFETYHDTITFAVIEIESVLISVIAILDEIRGVFCSRVEEIKFLKVTFTRAQVEVDEQRKISDLFTRNSENNAREYRFVPMPRDVNTLPTTIRR